MLRKQARYGLSILTGASATAILLVLWPTAAAAIVGNCNAANHWYAQVQSGCCAYATGILTGTPAQWSVDHPANSTTDEASWLIDPYNYAIAIEAGYYSGYFFYNNSWTNSLKSYMTLNNGTCCGATGATVAANKYLWMDDFVVDYIGPCGTEGADVGGTQFRFCYYEPRGINYAQGEVTASTKTWMGGGQGGEGFAGYWSPDASNYYLWGNMTGCYNSPYWLSIKNSYEYWNGGV